MYRILQRICFGPMLLEVFLQDGISIDIFQYVYINNYYLKKYTFPAGILGK